METNINVDLQSVIADLLEQIKRLTGDNAVLRSVVQQMQAEQQGAEAAKAPVLSPDAAEAPKGRAKAS
ncbi:MAG: hypothetical protein VW907_02235 [Opitutae bacterium]